MAAMGKGSGKTPENVIKLVKEEVQKLGQNGFSRAAGIPLRSVQKYLEGNAEPTSATLEKLAYYFNTSVYWLRGAPWATREGGVDLTFGLYDADLEKEVDRLLGVDSEGHREQQIRYIVQAAKLASEDELQSLVQHAQRIVSDHLGT